MKPAPRESVTVYGNIVRREYRIPAGQLLVSHKHPYDHFSILYSGEAMLTKNGVNKALKGPCMVEIAAGIEHEIFAVTECRWDCLHSLALAESAAENGDQFVMDGVT